MTELLQSPSTAETNCHTTLEEQHRDILEARPYDAGVDRHVRAFLLVGCYQIREWEDHIEVCNLSNLFEAC